MIERRFPLTKPPIGKSKGGVIVGDDFRVEHPLMRAAVTASLSEVAIVVRVRGRDGDVPLLKREVRRLDLIANAYTDVNVVIVFRSPVRFGPFKLGADQALALSGRERRSGVDVDAVGVTVDEPDELVATLTRGGARSMSAVGDALRVTIGEATGSEAAERIRSRTKARRMAQRALLIGGAVWTALFAVRIAVFDEEVPAATVLRIVASSLGWAFLVGVGVAKAAELRHEKESPGWLRAPRRRAFVCFAAVLTGFVVVLVLPRWFLSLVGPAHVLISGAIAGLPAGILVGLGLSRGERTGNAQDPLTGVPHGKAALLRGARAPAVALLALLVLSSAAIREPGKLSDLRFARSAVLGPEDLPPGWTETFAPGVFRGPQLTQHICGSDEENLPPLTAGYNREYSFNLRPNGHEEAHLVVAALVARTEDLAAEEFEAVNAPGYGDCAIRSVQRDALPPVQGKNGQPRTTFERTLLEGMPGVVDRFVTRVPTVDGEAIVFTAMVRMRLGRIIIRMPIMSYGAPFASDDVLEIASAALHKAQRAAT